MEQFQRPQQKNVKLRPSSIVWLWDYRNVYLFTKTSHAATINFLALSKAIINPTANQLLRRGESALEYGVKKYLWDVENPLSNENSPMPSLHNVAKTKRNLCVCSWNLLGQKTQISTLKQQQRQLKRYREESDCKVQSKRACRLRKWTKKAANYWRR